jgi:tetratricopeptide (TPR) repeat protein
MWRRSDNGKRSCARAVCVAGISVVGIKFALASPATAANCDWKANDPVAVIQSCTAHLSGEKAPAAWMYFNRGLAYKLLGKLDEAQRDYSKAIELDPAFGPAYANRGNILLLRNDLQGALVDYRKALALDPNDSVTRANYEAIEAALKKMRLKSGVGVSSGGSP